MTGTDRSDAVPAGPAEAVQQAIACPQCGGENALPAGEHFVECTFCDATLFVDRSAVVTHYRLPALLDQGGVAAALRRWMNGNETVKHLDRKSKIEPPTLAWFPMWLFRVRGAGGESVHVEPAAATPIAGLADLEVPAGKLEPYTTEQREDALAVTVPLATARRWLDQRQLGTVRESGLVHVPLWSCRYEYGGKSYETLVDGSTGTVLASVFPEKAEAPFYLIAILGILLFGIEGLIIQNPLLKLVVFAVTAVPMALLAYLVTRKV